MVTDPEIQHGLAVIRRFAHGHTWLHDEAVQAYRVCMARGIPVEQCMELLFMQQVDNPNPDFLVRRLYRFRLKGMRFDRVPDK